MDVLEKKDIAALTLGSALIGSGGGGSATYEPLMLASQLDRYGGLSLITIDDLCDDDLVLPIASMGAPSVSIEKLPSGREFDTIFRLVETVYGRRPSVIVNAEIGGSNAFTALLVAQRLGCKVLDADLIGRAFPRLEMSSPNLVGISAAPAFIADSVGRSAILYARDAQEIELLARQFTVVCGSSAAIGVYSMTGQEARKAVIPGSISQACSWGRTLIQAREAGISVGSYLATVRGCTVLARGVVGDVETQIIDGFTVGRVTVEGLTSCTLWYKNEFLKAIVSDGTSVATPTILALVDEDTGVTVQTDMLQYGLRVAVIALPAPAIWECEAGLALVGPQVFGL